MGKRRRILWVLATAVVLTALVSIVVRITSARDYTGVAVDNLPVEEQIKVARSVSLSAVVNWGEGGNMYSREVAEAFLLGHPYPDYLDARYGKPELFGRSKERNEIAFLVQTTIDHDRDSASGIPVSQDVVYQRMIEIYTGSGIYTIVLNVDQRGRILDSWSSFR